MRDTLSLVTTCPLGIDGVQVESNKDYLPAMKAEARRFIELLEKRFQKFDRISYKITSNPHDFGTYLDVEVIFNDENEDSENQVFFIESNLPEHWEDDTVYVYPECLPAKKEFETSDDFSDLVDNYDESSNYQKLDIV